MLASKLTNKSPRRMGGERNDIRMRALQTFEKLVAAGYEPRELIQFTNHILGLAVVMVENSED